MGNTGTDGVKNGEIYGNSRAALNQPTLLNGRVSTIRDLMNARAKAIYDYLIGKGIDPQRMDYGPGSKYSTKAGRNTSFKIANP